MFGLYNQFFGIPMKNQEKVFLYFVLCVFFVIQQLMPGLVPVRAVLLRNDTFETNLGDWQLGSGDSFGRDCTRAHGGSCSALTDAIDDGMGGYILYIYTDFAACSGLTSYWLSIWAYKEMATDWQDFYIEWWDSTSKKGQSDIPTDYTSSTGWFEITWSDDSPESATRYRIFLWMHHPSLDWTLTIDDAQFSDTAFFPRHDTFEAVLEDWQLTTGDSFVRDNTRAHGGTWSALADAKDTFYFQIILATGTAACLGSTPYWLSIWAYKEQIIGWQVIRIEWWDSTSKIGQSDIPTDYTSSTGWFEITWSGTSPASATRYRILVWMWDDSLDWTLTIDDAQFSDIALFPEFTASIALVFSVVAIGVPAVLFLRQKKQKKL
ncbi:MAG: hypothetical protein ACFFBD_25970 [Candidatus Hodarchaeota archaeon]